jgi:hypothetical protein
VCLRRRRNLLVLPTTPQAHPRRTAADIPERASAPDASSNALEPCGCPVNSLSAISSAPGAVGGRDAYRGIEGEAAAVVPLRLSPGRHRPGPNRGARTGAVRAQAGLHRAQEQPQGRALQVGVALQEVSQALGCREHPLPQRQLRQHAIGQMFARRRCRWARTTFTSSGRCDAAPARVAVGAGAAACPARQCRGRRRYVDSDRISPRTIFAISRCRAGCMRLAMAPTLIASTGAPCPAGMARPTDIAPGVAWRSLSA